MCKPGSSSGGSGLTSGGLGLAFAGVGIAAAVSTATALVSTIITAALITVFSLAAAGTVLLVIILCRTRGAVTWPARATMPSAAGRRTVPVPRRAVPAPSRPGRAWVRPVTAAAARPAVPARQPRAIEAPASVPVPVGVPIGPADRAMVAWPPAPAPGNRHHGPAPDEAEARLERQLLA
jgi:hypothetical protein